MKKRKAALLLAGVMGLSAVLMAGCGAGGTTQTAEPAAEETAEAETQETAQEEQTEETAEAGEAIEGEKQVLKMEFTPPTGSFKLESHYEDPSQLSEEEKADTDRAMRAYTGPSGESLLVNNAKSFYYYDQMTPEQQTLYDAMQMTAMDPESDQNIVTAFTKTDPYSEAFSNDYLVAYFGMLYDHPEFFWLYNDIEASIGCYLYGQNGDTYNLVFRLDDVFEDYQTQMKAFNEAAESFLAQIDTSGSEAETVKQIHDLLISKCAYNTAVMEKGDYANLAHTAYGALVADNDGNPNLPVCDGYSQAFCYLCQQCGIEATTIGGAAGSDEASAGGHAWSVVKIDGVWYEVDTTWDDTLDDWIASVETIKDSDPYSYGYYMEALTDISYAEVMTHYLMEVSTEQIRNYEPTPETVYTTKDNLYDIQLVGPSVHMRAYDVQGMEAEAELMKLAPEAVGTIH